MPNPDLPTVPGATPLKQLVSKKDLDATIRNHTSVLESKTAINSNAKSTSEDVIKGLRLSFPTNVEGLNNIPQYTYITARRVKQRYTSSNSSSIPSEQQEPLATLLIPLPRELSSSYRSDWQTLDLGLVEAVRTGTATNDVLNTVLKLAEQQGTSPAEKYIQATNLNMLNPYRVLEWRGPQQRTFHFTWELIPKSKNDSFTIMSICDVFKTLMHTPTVAYGASTQPTLKQPPIWNMKFCVSNSTDQNPYLFEVLDSAMTNLQVDYTPYGLAFHEGTNAPVGVRISADFTETIILTQQDFTTNNL